MKTLLFTAHGSAELLDDDGESVLWASDEDDEFAEENQNEFLKPEIDEDMILGYLVDAGDLDDDEEIDVEVETVEG